MQFAHPGMTCLIGIMIARWLTAFRRISPLNNGVCFAATRRAEPSPSGDGYIGFLARASPQFESQHLASWRSGLYPALAVMTGSGNKIGTSSTSGSQVPVSFPIRGSGRPKFFGCIYFCLVWKPHKCQSPKLTPQNVSLEASATMRFAQDKLWNNTAFTFGHPHKKKSGPFPPKSLRLIK